MPVPTAIFSGGREESFENREKRMISLATVVSGSFAHASVESQAGNEFSNRDNTTSLTQN
jgi:hypothetical protein